MFKYTDSYLIINGIKIHYYRTGGDKPPFILLHGATDNGLCWTAVADLLSANYDVIMPDAQGHGLSDRLGPDFTFRYHTEQVAGLVQELGLKKPLIMGHSMGAATAASTAAEYPDLPGAIILEDPPWQDFIPGAWAKEDKAFRLHLLDLHSHSVEENMIICRQENPGWAEAEIKPWAQSKLQFDATLFSRPIWKNITYDTLVPKINRPTLLITAENGIVTDDVAVKVEKLWSSKEPFKWVRVKGSGHSIHRDRFEVFKKALLDFLKTLD